MNRTPLEIVELSGSETDVAFDLGRLRKKKIEIRLEYWNHLMAKMYKGKSSYLKTIVAEFLKTAKELAPHYVDEIRAQAEGASVPFLELFRLNLTELKAFADKCSTLIFPIATKAGQGIIIAHNEDWNPDQNDVFILKVKLPHVSYQIVSYDGYLPGLSSGMNSFGLCHAINYVLAKDIRPAIPRVFITRYLVTSPSAKDCLNWIHKNKRAFGQSIHLAQGGTYTGIEITAKHVAVRAPKLPTLHTNHYLSPKLKTWAAKPSENSVKRLHVGNHLLKDLMQKKAIPLTRAQALAMAKRILSDRSGLPFALWREADSPIEASATVATAMFGTDSDEMLVYRHAPALSTPLRVKL